MARTRTAAGRGQERSAPVWLAVPFALGLLFFLVLSNPPRVEREADLMSRQQALLQAHEVLLARQGAGGASAEKLADLSSVMAAQQQLAIGASTPQLTLPQAAVSDAPSERAVAIAKDLSVVAQQAKTQSGVPAQLAPIVRPARVSAELVPRICGVDNNDGAPSLLHPRPLVPLAADSAQIARSRLAKVNKNGPEFSMFIHDPKIDEFVSGSIEFWGTWDEPIERILRVILASAPPSSLMLDVGGNIGFFSLITLSLGHRTMAFEPVETNIALFAATIAHNSWQPRARLFHNAVSHDAKRLSFNLDPTNQGGISMRQVDQTGDVYGRDYVDSIRLDDVVDEPVHVMKLDVESYEMHVMQGATQLFSDAKRRPRYVLVELY